MKKNKKESITPSKIWISKTDWDFLNNWNKERQIKLLEFWQNGRK